MWLTEAFPLLEGHHLHGFLKRGHVCLSLGAVCRDQWWWRRCGWWCRLDGLCPGWRWSPLRWKSANPDKLLWPLLFYRRRSREELKCVTATNKDTLLILVGSVWMQRCICVCVYVWFKPDSHILVISQRNFTSTCDIGAAVTYTFHTGWYKHEEKGVIRAAHYVESINNTWQ